MSREEILADFQACTGIEDLGMAIMHLEEANWVLVDAVNRAIPQDVVGGDVDPVQIPPTSSPPLEVIDDQGPLPQPPPPGVPPRLAQAMLQESMSSMLGPLPLGAGAGSSGAGVSLAPDFLPLGSSSRSRMLQLNIEYRDRMIPLKVPDHESIATVKTLLQAEVGVAPCQQELRGWSGAAPFPLTDRRLLSEMNLPKENFLYLITSEIPSNLQNGDQEDQQMIQTENNLKVTIVDNHSNKTYSLNFPGSHSVMQLKRDVATVTDIPVFRQEWEGWPDNCNDDLSLIQIGLPNETTLTVSMVRKHDKKSATASNDGASGSGSSSMPILVDDSKNSDVEELSDDDYQDAHEPMEEEDFFMAQPVRSGIQPLLPDDFGDEDLAGIKFGEEFSARYGQPHPAFFPGSLENALAEAMNKPVDERKMMAVYLHHDSSVLTNVFCTQVFCADAVIALMLENFITWGWDLTYASNKQRLLDMISRHFGSVASSTIRNLSIEKFPLVLIIAKLRGNLEIFQVIHGNVSLDEFMSSLLSSGESYQSQLGVERQEERERNERNMVKDEQEAAFREAQLLDQQKEVAMKEQEEESRLAEQVMEAKRRSEQEAKEAEKARNDFEQAAASSSLPAEPSPDCGEQMANIRFRTPRETLTRRFLATQTLELLLLYLRSKGYKPDQFKVLQSWPRRDLSSLSPGSSLADLKLVPQETLTLEALAQPGDSDSE